MPLDGMVSGARSIAETRKGLGLVSDCISKFLGKDDETWVFYTGTRGQAWIKQRLVGPQPKAKLRARLIYSQLGNLRFE